MSTYNGDYNSIENQEIKGKLVNREVISCQTSVVEYILEKSWEDSDAPFSWDDVENLYRKVCPECREDVEEIFEEDIVPIHKWKCGCCEELYDTKEMADSCCNEDDCDEEFKTTERWLCPFCEDEFLEEQEAKECVCHWREDIFKCYNGHYLMENDIDEEMQEIYEWWEVTNWFADKLASYGEVVIKGWNSYWGRCCTGQAILLDWVISKIAEDMEILDGQEHSWNKK